MDPIKFDIGAEGHVEVALIDGKAVITGKYVGADLEIDLSIKGSPRAALDKLKEVIPGSIDDMVIDGIESVLGLK